jgi:Zn-dependent peptidase ImmA (M78 family)
MSDKHAEINELINNIFKKVSLREMFEKRLYELGISQTAAERLLGIGHRPLNGLLDVTQKRVDYSTFKSVAAFLNMPIEELIEIHIKLIEEAFLNENTTSNKKKFIRENFDLAILRKAGFIDTINDFDKIEKKITSYLGLQSVFDYKKISFSTAFWAGKPGFKNPVKTSITRNFWLTSAKNFIEKLDNPYHYDRENLIKFFPQIRWHSTNVEFGLFHIIKALFRLGITVVFQPRLSTLYLRGVTFSVNNKPCIVLTDYKGFYPTLFHCLIHELYHVLFDWDEIKADNYHISEGSEDLLVLDEREVQADDFARRYLFSEEKMREVEPYMRTERIVKEIAEENNIHPSIIYIYNAFDKSKVDRLVWMRAKRYMPDIKKATYKIEIPWDDKRPLVEIVREKKMEIYN